MKYLIPLLIGVLVIAAFPFCLLWHFSFREAWQSALGVADAFTPHKHHHL